MEDFEKRMITEYQQLREKCDKLGYFLMDIQQNPSKREECRKIAESGEMFYMENQLHSMVVYCNMLIMRLRIHGLWETIEKEEQEARAAAMEQAMNVAKPKDDEGVNAVEPDGDPQVESDCEVGCDGECCCEDCSCPNGEK